MGQNENFGLQICTIILIYQFAVLTQPVSAFHEDEADLTCHVCNETFYCIDGEQFLCPQNSLADFPLASNITDCVCNNGYEASEAKDSCSLGLQPFYYIDGIKYACIENKRTLYDGAPDVKACVCNRGLFGVPGNSVCSPCANGFYADKFNMSSCLQCPVNSFVVNEDKPIAAVNITECLCNAGFTGNDGGPCLACVAGKFKEDVGSALCSTCRPNTFSAEQAVTCVECPLNSTSSASSISVHNCSCDPGFYRVLKNGKYECEKCAAGRFKAVSGNNACDFCEDGFITPYTGATTCLQCLANTQSSPAQYGGTTCLCNAGFFLPSPSNPIFLSNCTACAPNTFQHQIASTACLNCHENAHSEKASTNLFQCICNAGYYETNIDGTCAACARGTYKPVTEIYEEDAHACSSCPTNSTSPVASDAVVDCHCKAGFTGDNGTDCLACDSGKFKNELGDADCLLCDQNFYATKNILFGTTVCQDCVAFMNSPHAITQHEGTESSAGCGCDFTSGFGEALTDLNKRTCSICPSGQFSNSTFVNIPGLSQAAPRSICTSCVLGTFTAAAGQTTCDVCLANSLSYDFPHIGCQCNAGYYFDSVLSSANAAGFASCVDCEVDTFKDSYGNVDCLQCQDFSTSDLTSTNQTQCECEVGYFENIQLDHLGHTCQACAAGFFNDIQDAESCKNCDVVTNVRSYTPDSALPWDDVDDCFACEVCNTSSNVLFLDHYDNARAGLGCGENAASDCTECPLYASLFVPSTDLTWNAGVESCVCDSHYYGPAGNICSACPTDRRRSPHVRESIILDCKCPAGTEPDGVSTAESMAACLLCDYAEYKETEADVQCSLCPSTLTTEYRGTSHKDWCVCAPGNLMSDASAEFDDLQCANCPTDTFSDTYSRDETCTSCFPHSTSALGSAHRFNCLCLPGFEMLGDPNSTGLCSACVPGQFKPSTKNELCSDCNVNTFAFYNGTDVCENCPQFSSTINKLGQVRCACNAGHEESWVQTTYSVDEYPVDVLTNDNLLSIAFTDPPSCLPCRLGTFKTTANYVETDTSLLSSSACDKCSTCGHVVEFGQVALECNSTHDIVCKSCQANSMPVLDTKFIGPCLCIAGYELVETNGEYTCEACAPGFYNNVDDDNTIKCLPCPNLTFTGEFASTQCTTCKTHCDTINDVTFYVHEECNATRDVICKDCQICPASFYAQHQCGLDYANDRKDTLCVECPENFFCPGEAISILPVECPSFSTSENGSISVHDCDCNAGRYFYNDTAVLGTDLSYSLGENVICKICPHNTYCFAGSLQPTECPEHAITRFDENRVRSSCNCLARYYRYPENDLLNFTCHLCTENDFCFNNSRFDCPDDLMRLPVGQYSPENCTCISPYYNNETKCEICKVDHFCLNGQQFECVQNEWTNFQTGQDSCLCRPGFARNSIGVCELCNTSTYCDGTDDVANPFLCPQNSETITDGAYNIASCLCKAGFQNSSVPSHENPHTCVACQLENISLGIVGTFKPTHANTACSACEICDPTGKYEFTSVHCTRISDAHCKACAHCYAPNASYDRLKYETFECQRFKNTQCANCSQCDFAYEWQFQDCLAENDRICDDISFNRSCPVGEFAGKHTLTSDSNCSTCLYHDTLYEGKRMHVATTAGRIYNDPYSCDITCLSFSRLRDPNNVSLGCISCETGNVLLKNFIQDPRSLTCNFTCKNGYVLNRFEDDIDGDCTIGALPPTHSYYKHDLNVTSIQRVVRSDLALYPDQTAAAFRLRISHTAYGHFVIAVGADEPTCTSREQRHHNMQCCFSALYRISSKSQLGLSETQNESCSQASPLWHTSVSPTLTDFEIPDSRLADIGNCISNGTEVLNCEITISIIDTLLFQYTSVQARLQLTRGQALATVSGEHRYIPLEAFFVDIHLAYMQNNSPVYAIVSNMKSLAKNVYDGRIAVKIRGVGMQFVQPSSEYNCARLQVAEGDALSVQSWTLYSGNATSTTSFFLMPQANAQAQAITLYYTLHLLDRSTVETDNRGNIMDIVVWRNTSLSHSVCAVNVPTAHIKQGEVFSASGLGKTSVLQMSKLNNAAHAVRGELGGLTSFIARGLYSYISNVQLVSMLTTGTLASASHLLLNQNVTHLQHGQLVFDHNFRQNCLATTACFYQYLQYDPHGSGIYQFNNCSSSHQSAARNWLARIYGVNNDHGHIEQLCKKAVKQTPFGSQYRYNIVLVNTRSYLPHVKAWHDLQNQTAAFSVAKVFAMFRYT